MSENESPAAVAPGMLLLLLHDSPMKPGQSAVMTPGFIKEFPDFAVLMLNQSDFDWFTTKLSLHNMKLEQIHDDMRGNSLYMIETADPIILNS